MDIYQKVFSLEIGPRKIQKECSKGKVDSWLIVGIESVDEFTIVLYFFTVLSIPFLAVRIGI